MRYKYETIFLNQYGIENPVSMIIKAMAELLKIKENFRYFFKNSFKAKLN
tara:strand:+ start:116 stop:265 length:150 start_codon:yes stop_codon:yes gene_type:complete